MACSVYGRDVDMKKFFRRKEEQYNDDSKSWWELEESEYGSDEDEYYTDSDEVEIEDEYYADSDEELEEDEYYADSDEELEEDEYYADSDEELEEDEYYADSDEALTEDEYYADSDEELIEDEYYADSDEELIEDEYYADSDEELTENEYYEDSEGEFQEDVYYAEDYEEIDDREESPAYYREDKYYKDRVSKDRSSSRTAKNDQKKPFLLALWHKFLDMGTMDRIIAATGAAVLILALVTGSVYASAKVLDKQIDSFVSVGRQLQDINLIGEAGLLAVADAQSAKIAAANMVYNEVVEEDEVQEYDESEYSKDVTVILNMTSIQKDLKIKFVNKKSNKLISNVPFSVTVTTPDGKTEVWEDNDKDGIIYKSEITPGTYKVSINSLDNEKYADYTLPGTSQSVDVKKEAAYQKVDVSDEIKSESEVNVALEDTQLNETAVESKLTDTVGWVNSTVVNETYTEIAKSKIPDPTSIALTNRFLRTASYKGSVEPSIKTLNVGESFTVQAVYNGNLSGVTWSSSNPSVATVEPNGLVKAVGKGTATISYTHSTVSGNDTNTITGACNVTVNENLVKGNLTASNGAPVIAVGVTTSVKVTASGFTSGKTLAYTAASSNTKVATAIVDGEGNVSITGVAAGTAQITVAADYKENSTGTTAASTVINVTVSNNKVITLDKTAATVYIGTPVTITATVTNATSDQAVTAISSDANVATVSVSGKKVTITGQKTGSATITVQYTQNGEEVKTTCAVTVKTDPKNDRTTKLKDTDGNQLYVLVNNAYVEAVTADYYTADKFFIRGEPKYTGWQTLNGSVYYFDANGKKVTGEQVIQGAKYTFASDGSLVQGSGTMGIDVSKWNGTIDWNAVKNSGVSYVIIRCGYRGSSQGSLIEDPKFKDNIKGANAAGLKVGVYFFTQAINVSEAIEEASMTLQLIKNYKISYPVFLDVESSGGRADSISKDMRTQVCIAYCQTIQNAGYTAGIYANKNWLTTKINASQLNAYKIWLAQYASAPTYSGRYDLWQYSSTGRVSGISGNVDLNISYLGY